MDRKMEIQRRAAELFARKGVAETSMEDIAKAVGIKREGIYYYYPNRGAILLDIILPQSTALLRNIQRIRDTGNRPVDQLKNAIASHLDSYNPNYIEMNVALREHHFSDDKGEDRRLKTLKSTWQSYERHWRELILEGQAEGAFSKDLDAKLVAFGLLGMCNWVCRWYRPGGEISITEIADTYAALAVRGLAAGGEQSAIKDVSASA